jgi:tryptophan 2,3-dioxygenase
MLFIVQHQTSELWMKLMLHEMHAVRTHLQADDLPPAFKMLARVARIMDQLVHAWDVLATMTPPEYTAIRPYLGASSGFQSYQYREIEFILGNKNPALLNVHATTPEFAVLEQALHTPSSTTKPSSCWRATACPSRRTPERRLDPAYRGRRLGQQAWLEVYRDPTRYWALYELAEKLVDWKRRSASGASAT